MEIFAALHESKTPRASTKESREGFL
ncbi:hypothetical protein NPIL_282311, partial [Nephila pilipes]